MAERSNLEIVISALNAATGELRGLQTQLNDLKAAGKTGADGLSNVEKTIRGSRTTIGGLDKDITVLGKNIGSTADLMAGLGVSLPVTPMLMLGQAMSKGIDYAKQSVEQTLSYDMAVRNLARNLNITTEETSRIVQVADDFGIEQGQVTQALQMAVKNGFAPSIESIAKMADVYKSTSNPLERASRLTAVFGKNWAALTPMLDAGGDAIRNAAAGMQSGLLVTQQQSEEAERYRRALDDLNDVTQAWSYTLGNTLMPKLTGVLRGLKETADFLQSGKLQLSDETKSAIANEWGIQGYGPKVDPKGMGDLRALEFQQDATARAARELADAETAAQLAMAGLQMALAGTVTKTNQGFVDQQKGIADKIKETEKALTELGANPNWTPAQAGQVGDLQKQLGNAWTQLRGLEKGAGVQTGAFNPGPDMWANLKGQGVDDGTIMRVSELQSKIGQLQTEITKLGGKPYVTGEQKQQISDLTTQLDGLKTQQTQSKDEQDKANKQILFNMLQQQLAAKGINDPSVYMQIAEKWGLVDQATATAWKEAETMANKIVDAQKATNALGSAISGIPGFKEVIVQITAQGDLWALGQGGGKGGGTSGNANRGKTYKQRAGGGSVAFGNLYQVNEAGVEYFQPNTSGRIIPLSAGTQGGKSAGGDSGPNYNFYFGGNLVFSSKSDVIRASDLYRAAGTVRG